ncbi:Swi3-domain-containing protein [Viridothelium virens]|uniref:Chromosome segregation in meiosis protein n=1 Tax=Viridothelium virens TaxID=1048519 RepID=A0A6A6H3X6_VIRVR|nr:Swi3-domain-containing protein [Viridothelium virens]
MPLLDESAHYAPERDDLDDLFNHDASLDDVFKDTNDGSNAATDGPPESRRRAADGGADLGIDEEIKITKRRQPIAKLDEARLLSNAGIPKLRKITKERLKFRGKGHEFSDVSRLLNIYQLWLDDLYPRAKFADGLAMIEKLGHRKTMQMKRKEWIDESKPRIRYDTTPEPTEQFGRGAPNDTENAEEREVAIQDMDVPGSPQDHEDHPEGIKEAIDTAHNSVDTGDDDGEGDDLDAIMAEHTERMAEQQRDSNNVAHPRDDFADEMDAMAELDDIW